MTRPGSRRLDGIIRPVVLAVITCGVAWWLFADTFARYAPSCEDIHSIRFSHFGTYQDYQLWKAVIAEFENAHPGVSVHQEYVVGLTGHYNTKMRQQVLTHTLPDVALIQLGPFHELAEHFADLSGLLQESSGGDDVGNNSTLRDSIAHDHRTADTALLTGLDPTGLAAFQYHGRQGALPVSGGNLLIYANPTCFARAGRFLGRQIPLPGDDWTIEGFRHTAELLTCDFDGDGSIDQFGFWHPRWIYYLPFLWSFGAELTNDTTTEWRLVGREAEQAFEFYRELLLGGGGRMPRRVCPRPDEVPQLFQDVGFLTGRVGMCINGPWFQPFLASTDLADSYVVAPIPSGPAGRVTRITWDGVVIPANLQGARRAIAEQFVTHLLSGPVQDAIARTGKALPARTRSAPAFIDPPGDTRRQRFVDALSYSRIQPPLPRFGEVDRVINAHLRRLLDRPRDLTAAAMLDSLARDPVIAQSFVAPKVASP